MPIKIEYNSSAKSDLSIKSFDEEIFEEIFENTELNAENLKEFNNDELIDMTNLNMLENNFKTTTIKTSSTCSSRTSYTSSENSNNDDNESEESKNDADELVEDIQDIEDEGEWEDVDSDSDSTSDTEEKIEAIIADIQQANRRGLQ